VDDEVVDVVDVLLVRVLGAAALMMAVTAEHWLSAPASARAVTLPPVTLVLALPEALASAFFEESALQVRSTKSPALIAFRLATALPCTGRVIDCVALADAVAPAPLVDTLSVCFTVMVFELASTAMTSAFTLASFFVESDFSSAFAGVLSSRIKPGSVVLVLGC